MVVGIEPTRDPVHHGEQDDLVHLPPDEADVIFEANPAQEIQYIAKAGIEAADNTDPQINNDEEIQEQVDTLNNQIQENLRCDTDLNAYIRLLLPNYSSYLDNRY